jgi:hypothetical protein
MTYNEFNSMPYSTRLIKVDYVRFEPTTSAMPRGFLQAIRYFPLNVKLLKEKNCSISAVPYSMLYSPKCTMIQRVIKSEFYRFVLFVFGLER